MRNCYREFCCYRRHQISINEALMRSQNINWVYTITAQNGGFIDCNWDSLLLVETEYDENKIGLFSGKE